ncbi:MAG: NAD(P)/FAD-dependent oxidoreductase [Bacteroidota bacterium]
MNRQDFLKNCTALGMGLPFLSLLMSSCKSEDPIFPATGVNFSGKVLIVGAGAAGLVAGHILQKQGIDFEILEASAAYGGRVKKIEGFADFPIDLGAEWIHTDLAVFSRLLQDPNKQASIDTIVYSPDIYFWKNQQLKRRKVFSNFYSEYKFKNTTWYDFFEQHIVPNIADKIRYDTAVTTIDYSGDKVVLTSAKQETFTADKVLLTVPINILKQQLITFEPAMPADKAQAIQAVDMPAGIKVFMEFSEKFFPDLVYDGGLSAFLGGTSGEKIFYDAAYRKESDRNILALFNVGESANRYVDLKSDDEIIQTILGELDEMFDGKASATYMNHVIQNWSKEPYILGSYSHHADYSLMDILRQPLDNKVYFSGEAYAESDATVHGAGESSYVALERMLKYLDK